MKVARAPSRVKSDTSLGLSQSRLKTSSSVILRPRHNPKWGDFLYSTKGGKVKGPTSVVTNALYFFFLALLISAELLNWAPYIRFYNALPYFFLCAASFELSRIFYAKWEESVMPVFLTLLPFAICVFVSREAHLFVGLVFYSTVISIQIMSPRSDLRLYVLLYTGTYLIVYLAVVLLMQLFYVDVNGENPTIGRVLDPPIVWAQEAVVVFAVIISCLALLALERFVQLQNQAIKDGEASAQRLRVAYMKLSNELKTVKLAYETPLDRAVDIIHNLSRTADAKTQADLDMILKVIGGDNKFAPDMSEENDDEELREYMRYVYNKASGSKLGGRSSSESVGSRRTSILSDKNKEIYTEMKVQLPGQIDEGDESTEGAVSLPTTSATTSPPHMTTGKGGGVGGGGGGGGGGREATGGLGASSELSASGGGSPAHKSLHLSVPELRRVSFTLENAVEALDNWNFDIFALSQLTNGRPLFFVSFGVFVKYDLINKFNIDKTVLFQFLKRMEEGYGITNPYHNSIHAADVTQAMHYFLAKGGLDGSVREIDVLAIFVAAIIHDFKHPALNNAYLIATQDPLAVLYNDQSVLENHHLTQGFKVLSLDSCNILSGLSKDDARDVREAVIDMVLGTDLKRHFDIVGRFKAKTSTMGEGSGLTPTLKDDRSLLLQMAIKCADVSNPARTEALCHCWADRIVQEFFAQGDLEKKNGLPVSPLMDRDTVKFERSQVMFIDVIVRPLFTCFASYPPILITEALDNIDNNRRAWEAATVSSPTTALPNVPSESKKGSPTIGRAGKARSTSMNVRSTPTLGKKSVSMVEED